MSQQKTPLAASNSTSFLLVLKCASHTMYEMSITNILKFRVVIHVHYIKGNGFPTNWCSFYYLFLMTNLLCFAVFFMQKYRTSAETKLIISIITKINSKANMFFIAHFAHSICQCTETMCIVHFPEHNQTEKSKRLNAPCLVRICSWCSMGYLCIFNVLAFAIFTQW